MRFIATRSIALLLPLILPADGARAQEKAAVVGSTVSGRVLCGDSNTPARFAKILLKPTTPEHPGDDFMKEVEDNVRKATAKGGKTPAPVKPQTPEQKRQRAAAARNMDQAVAMMNASSAGLDGAYSFTGVKPGTYYVHAIYPGYVDDFGQVSEADFASSDPSVRARIAALPTVTVSGTDAARMDLRLARGGVISGRVLFDDGTPAAGWWVWALLASAPVDPGSILGPAMEAQAARDLGGPVALTDDRGGYRIAGLAGGSYLVRANLGAMPSGVSGRNIGQAGTGIRLTVYAGNTFSRSTAKAIPITHGEERPGVDVTVRANALHTIVGHVHAKSDDHALNSGTVTLTAASDPAVHLQAAIRDDGSFHFEDLPENTTYTLKVDKAADATYKAVPATLFGLTMPSSSEVQTYQSATQDVLLGGKDNTDVLFSLVPVGKSAELHDAPPE